MKIVHTYEHTFALCPSPPPPLRRSLSLTLFYFRCWLLVQTSNMLHCCCWPHCCRPKPHAYTVELDERNRKSTLIINYSKTNFNQRGWPRQWTCRYCCAEQPEHLRGGHMHPIVGTCISSHCECCPTASGGRRALICSFHWI